MARKRNKKGEGWKEDGIKKERRTERKKEFRGDGGGKKKSSPGFKPVRLVPVVFLSVKLDGVGGGIGFTFLPS